jgi:hypothetical protein
VAFAGFLGCFAEDRNYGYPRHYGDAQISSAIESKLDSHGMQQIDVSTSDGTVFLTGVVIDADTRDYAGRLASRTRGVTRVVNNIQLASRRSNRAGDAPDDWRRDRDHGHPWVQGGH